MIKSCIETFEYVVDPKDAIAYLEKIKEKVSSLWVFCTFFYQVKVYSSEDIIKSVRVK